MSNLDYILDYDKEKHIELLKLKERLKDGNQLFSFEKQVELDKALRNYRIALEYEIIWRKRYFLYYSVEDFLSGEISARNFCGRIFGIRNRLKKTLDKFELFLKLEMITNFKLDERSVKLESFLTQSFILCDSFLDQCDPASNKIFQDFIAIGFLNLKDVRWKSIRLGL